MARVPAPQSSNTPAVVGKSAVVRGRISGDGDLRIEGAVQGDVAVRGELTISQGADVAADVQARTMVVAGALEGDIQANEGVTIRATAQVNGAIRATKVAIEEGASVSGRIESDFELPPELGGKPGRS